MKFSHFFVLFLIILTCVSTPILFRTNIVAKNAQLNNDYSNYLITATKSAVDAAATGNTSGTYIFDTTEKRKSAVDAFYKTLKQCFNYEYSTYEPMVYTYVPCVVLVDTDGFYIEYGEDYDEPNGSYATYDIISPIHKWSRSYSPGNSADVGYEFYVEFHLDDTIEIVFIRNNEKVTTYSGYYADVYDQLCRDKTKIKSMTTGDPIVASNLDQLLSDYKMFYNEKKEIIISEIQSQLEYYINTKTETNNQYSRYQYQFTLPKVTGQDWARMVDAPTILSFMQGPQTEYGTSSFNIYALAGSEMEFDYIYYLKDVDGSVYYHLPECAHLSDEDTEGMRGYTMEGAAKMGAYPCPDCILER